MKVRVLIVDDSKFFRRRVAEIINADPNLEVVGQAENGHDGIKLALELKPDVITMDIEMPVMDGITAVRRIMAQRPTPIIMFSSLTSDGAKSTLDALDAGAADYLPKRFEDIAKDKTEGKQLLCNKLVLLGRRGPGVFSAPRATSAKAEPRTAAKPLPSTPATSPFAPRVSTPVPTGSARAAVRGDIKLIAIGVSTGGPVALQRVLTQLPEKFPIPILVVQHMPGSFTPAFAQRLDQACKIRVKEAADGDVLQPGWAYIAPGGKQMVLDPRVTAPTLRVIAGDPSLNYKPSVDVTFKSIQEIIGGKVLAVIMTGMGADGREGVRALKTKGAEAWAQDEKSCVVYGMPAALVDAGLADRVYDLADIAGNIVRKVM